VILVTTSPRVRVIIVNYNGGALLQRCVEHLLRQTEGRFEAVIVDNASHGGPPHDLAYDPRITVMAMEKNLGFAAANNRGFVGCKTPFVALLNPDAYAEPTWLEALLSSADAAPNFGMFASRQLQAENPEYLDGAGDVYFCAGTFWRGGYGAPAEVCKNGGEVFGPCAAAALYRSENFRAAGGFDESYFCYAEDVDLAFRLRIAGTRCMLVHNAVVAHAGSALTGRGSDFTVYHLVRNNIWTFVKCMPGPLLGLLAPAHAAFLVWTWWRMRKTGQSVVVRRAVTDAATSLPIVWKKRRALQSARRAGIAEIASALEWRLGSLRRREIAIRPLRQPS
jgi:N-acetylglucosaminyl-diphospho-decaprenol L-rhamnosyltransferase